MVRKKSFIRLLITSLHKINMNLKLNYTDAKCHGNEKKLEKKKELDERCNLLKRQKAAFVDLWESVAGTNRTYNRGKIGIEGRGNKGKLAGSKNEDRPVKKPKVCIQNS